MSMHHSLRQRILQCLLATSVALSAFGLWFQHPLASLAYYNCSTACYAKTGWTGTVNTVAGEEATIHLPQNIALQGGSIHDAVWVWNDNSGEFVSSGIVAFAGTNNAYFYHASQLNNHPYQEYLDSQVQSGMFGYNDDVYVYKDPNNSAQYITGNSPACCGGPAQYIYAPFFETRTMIGVDSTGTGLGFWYTSWQYNKYVLYPGYGVYYHHGSQPEWDRVSNPPYAQWNPRPENDPNQIGGTWEAPGN